MFERHKPQHVPISRDVPLPTSNVGARRPLIDWPFAKMEIGDSFWVQKSAANVRSAAHDWKIRWDDTQSKRFTIAKEGTGARCWRVA